jgi:hypothetical protein
MMVMRARVMNTANLPQTHELNLFWPFFRHAMYDSRSMQNKCTRFGQEKRMGQGHAHELLPAVNWQRLPLLAGRIMRRATRSLTTNSHVLDFVLSLIPKENQHLCRGLLEDIQKNQDKMEHLNQKNEGNLQLIIDSHAKVITAQDTRIMTLNTNVLGHSGHLHYRGVILELEMRFRRDNPDSKVNRRQLWVNLLNDQPVLSRSLGDCMPWEKDKIPHGSDSRNQALAAMIVAMYGRSSAIAHPHYSEGSLPNFPNGTAAEKCFVQHLCAELGVIAKEVFEGQKAEEAAQAQLIRDSV